ncbi:MAG TPA: hypothetical protein VGH28_16610 [Polyangiaceae bacterium]|jgi:hypothetical protein
MPKAFDSWQVFPHRPLEKLERNLWRIEGDLPNGNGTRVMTIVKTKGGGLLVHNAIALEDDLMKEIEAFGDPAWIVVPNGFHRLDSKVYKQRYPKAKILAPGGAKKKVEQVVPVEGSYDERIDDDVKLAHLDGLKESEGVVEVKHDGKTTLVFNDCVNNLPKLSGLFGFLLAPTGTPAVPRITRWFMMKNRAAFRGHLEKLADTAGLARVIVSHGKPMTDAPGDVLKTVAARLG